MHKGSTLLDRLPAPMWKRIDRWSEYQGHIRRLGAHILVPQRLPVAKGGLPNVEGDLRVRRSGRTR